MSNKDEIKKQELNEEELDNVAGGGCWFGAKDVAPDGHDIGCHLSCSWYDSWEEYKYKKGICIYCGGKLESERSVSSSKYKPCSNCGWGNHNEWD